MKESNSASENQLHLTRSPSGRVDRWAEEGVKPNTGLDLLRHKSFPSPAWEISLANVENMV